jgi:hypothetical protein
MIAWRRRSCSGPCGHATPFARCLDPRNGRRHRALAFLQTRSLCGGRRPAVLPGLWLEAVPGRWPTGDSRSTAGRRHEKAALHQRHSVACLGGMPGRCAGVRALSAHPLQGHSFPALGTAPSAASARGCDPRLHPVAGQGWNDGGNGLAQGPGRRHLRLRERCVPATGTSTRRLPRRRALAVHKKRRFAAPGSR